MVTVDEGIRFDASEESLSGLNTLTDEGVLTAEHQAKFVMSSCSCYKYVGLEKLDLTKGKGSSFS